MKKDLYIVASTKNWHINGFNQIKKKIPGEWLLLNKVSELKFDNLNQLNPRYIFFPHWSEKVPNKIIEKYECICFHETDLPFGRGGSPIQNLISMGFESTKISALKMTSEFDEGPIYLKTNLSLLGLAEEIYIRSAKIVYEMIERIINEDIKPINQEGLPTKFKRRNARQSFIPKEVTSLEELFDFIRMLDAEDYPSAKLIYNKFLFEFERPALRTDKIEANVIIKKFS